MRVQDVMTDKVQTIGPSATADAAWQQMRVNRIHHLVVIRGPDIVGVLSDRDAGGRLGAPVRAGRSIKDLMTGRVVIVAPTTPVRKAANLMRGRGIGCLVVVERGHVAGIVTTADLLDLLGRGVERPVASTTRWTLHHRTPHHRKAAPTGIW